MIYIEFKNPSVSSTHYKKYPIESNWHHHLYNAIMAWIENDITGEVYIVQTINGLLGKRELKESDMSKFRWVKLCAMDG